MTSNATTSLSAREVEILCAMCKSLKSKPQVDMQLFATLAGFTTPGSATTNLSKVLKKVKDVSTASPSPEVSKKGSARKRKVDAEDSNDVGVTDSTPSKKTKKLGGTGKGKAVDEAEEGDDVLIKDEQDNGDATDELA